MWLRVVLLAMSVAVAQSACPGVLCTCHNDCSSCYADGNCYWYPGAAVKCQDGAGQGALNGPCNDGCGTTNCRSCTDQTHCMDASGCAWNASGTPQCSSHCPHCCAAASCLSCTNQTNCQRFGQCAWNWTAVTTGSSVVCSPGMFVVAQWGGNQKWYSGKIHSVSRAQATIMPDNGISVANVQGWTGLSPSKIYRVESKTTYPLSTAPPNYWCWREQSPKTCTSFRLSPCSALVPKAPCAPLSTTGPGGCSGASYNLKLAQCSAWKALFDATQGFAWRYCSAKRLDPCSCQDPAGNYIRRRLYAPPLGSVASDAVRRLDGNYNCGDGGRNLLTLSLISNNLNGTIPRNFANLTALQNIFMQNNPLLRGTIPTLQTFSALQQIRLFSTGLWGTIPALDALTSLELLDMRSMPALAGSLPPLGSLQALQYLLLQDNRGLVGTIPPMSNLTELNIWDMRNCRLQGTIPSLDTLTKLQVIHLDTNHNLTGSLPSFRKLTALREIEMGHLSVTGTIPDLSGLSALEQLDLTYNPGLRGTLPDVSGLTLLQQYEVSFCTGLHGPLPRGLDKLTGLRSLQAANSNLSGAVPSLNFSQYVVPTRAGGPLQSACALAGNNFRCPIPPAASQHCLVLTFGTYTAFDGTFYVNNRGPPVPYLGCGCGPGNFSAGANSPCRICPLDTYSSGSDNTNCTVCPDRTVTTKRGATSRLACIATVGLVFYGLGTSDVVLLLCIIVVGSALVDFWFFQQPRGHKLAEIRRVRSKRNVMELGKKCAATQHHSSIPATEATAVEVEMRTMQTNPGVAEAGFGDGMGQEGGATEQVKDSGGGSTPAAPLTGTGTGQTDELSENKRKRAIAAAVAAIDLANFCVIVIDFNFFASKSVVNPVAQLVLALFFVKVGLACLVYLVATVAASSFCPVAVNILRIFSCAGTRYDHLVSQKRACVFHSRRRRMLREEVQDFARSLRFSAAVGSLTFGVMCLSNSKASLEFARLNDRPLGVGSLLNALAIVKASFAVFVNVRILQLHLLSDGSTEFVFIVASLVLGVVRLATTIFVAAYLVVSRLARQQAARRRELARLRGVIQGVRADVDVDLLAAHLVKPVRDSVRAYDAAHHTSLRGHATLPLLLKTYYMPGLSDTVDEGKVDGVVIRYFDSPPMLVQQRPCDVEAGSERYLDWLFECAAEAQEILKHMFVPDYPDKVDWNAKLKDSGTGTLISDGVLHADPPSRTFVACDPGLKGRARTLEKSGNKYRDSYGLVHYERLRDLSRLALQFERFEDMEAVLNAIMSDLFRGNIVRIENRYFNPTVLGWRDVQLLVRVPLVAHRGYHHICELQLQHKLLAQARRAAHKHYESIRTRLALSVPAGEHDKVQEYVLGRLNNGVRGKHAGVPSAADVLFYCVR